MSECRCLLDQSTEYLRQAFRGEDEIIRCLSLQGIPHRPEDTIDACSSDGNRVNFLAGLQGTQASSFPEGNTKQHFEIWLE
jgi:hypothetical protein